MLRRLVPLLLITLIGLTNLHAALPQSVDGAPLPSLAPMLERSMPAVVNIATQGSVVAKDNPLLRDPFFEFFFNEQPRQPKRQRKSQSLGSGVIVDADKGYILTNHHVIAQADTITVTLRDARRLEAKVIGTDPESDVAVIQIEADKLTALPLADSDTTRVGDFVVAIGNPFGLGQTVTSGIVSALGRSGLGIEGYEDFIQTDASINPGNSGGALVNLHGELVGINTAIIAPGGGNVGIGFAIPVNMASSLMQQLVEFGEVRRGLLGVTVQDFTPELAEAFDVPITQGALINEVMPDSAAAEAGLESGDIVTSVNGRAVKNAADLRNAIGLARAGSRVKLALLRDGRKKTLSAKILSKQALSSKADAIHPRLAGATLKESDEDTDRPVVLVAEIETGSPAWQSGLRKGDIIVAANRQSVDSLQDLKQAVSDQQRPLLLNIRRGRGSFFLVIR